MMAARAYAVWATVVLVMLGVAQYRGWTMTSVEKSKTNPRSVRDNPGAYRSTYYVPGRTLRGK